MTAILGSFALNEYRALWRGKFAFVWFIALPAVASAILGPAVAGLDRDGATGRVLIGFAVMFSYMSVNYVGRALYREFDSQTWRRTAIADPSRGGFLLGKCLAVYTITFGQLAGFTAYAVTALGLPLASGTVTGAAQITLILLPLALSGVAIGALLYTLLRRAEVYFSLTYLILMVLAAMGGALVPSSKLPGWSQAAGHVTPHYWAMRALDEATLGAGNWGVIVQSAAVLTLMSLAIMAIAASRLDLRRECYAV
jgi:ABC-2 type transport system permease protein